jgi:hypothetical protein
VMTKAQASKLAGLTPGSGGASTFPDAAAFPAAGTNQGKFAIAADTSILYCANNGGWFPIAVLA